jgi:predicted XRE-type DNA-binding protein
MKETNSHNTPSAYEHGSDNVFADLGLYDADERFTRAKLGFHAHQLLTVPKLKQREIAELLAIKQPKASHWLNGHFSRFTTDKANCEATRLASKRAVLQESRKPERTKTRNGPCGVALVLDHDECHPGACNR